MLSWLDYLATSAIHSNIDAFDLFVQIYSIECLIALNSYGERSSIAIAIIAQVETTVELICLLSNQYFLFSFNSNDMCWLQSHKRQSLEEKINRLIRAMMTDTIGIHGTTAVSLFISQTSLIGFLLLLFKLCFRSYLSFGADDSIVVASSCCKLRWKSIWNKRKRVNE